jgi:hypothetical protein
MAKRDNLGGGSRPASDSPGSDLDPNPNPEGVAQKAQEAKDLESETPRAVNR